MPDKDDNPFRSLDKRVFPEKRSAAKKKAPARQKQPKPATPDMLPDTPAESDDALFLQAMGDPKALDALDHALSEWTDNVPPLATRRQARPAHKTLPPPPAAPAQPSPEHKPPKQTPPDQAPPEPLSDFASAMRDVRPLAGKGREISPEPERRAAPSAALDPLRDFMEGKFDFALQHTNEYVEGHVIGLDPITIGKLQAGRFSPEGSLDLHGMNALQAYQCLIGFMRNAYLRTWRTVLLVPGRGLNSPNGLSVLREKVQTWLTQEPLRRVVLAFCTAQAADGGAGALYVLLRKQRKGQGKVQWDRTPVDPDLLLS
jgi:DNA-nicking Smr family endonuclease